MRKRRKKRLEVCILRLIVQRLRCNFRYTAFSQLMFDFCYVCNNDGERRDPLGATRFF